MTSLSTYDFSTLYTTLLHNLIKDKLIDLIERCFNREFDSMVSQIYPSELQLNEAITSDTELAI